MLRCLLPCPGEGLALLLDALGRGGRSCGCSGPLCPPRRCSEEFEELLFLGMVMRDVLKHEEQTHLHPKSPGRKARAQTLL